MKGSIFINNTSYSGTDIQLVIHSYSKDLATKDRVEQLQTDFDRDRKSLDHYRGVITRVDDVLSTIKPSTPEYEKYSSMRRRAQDQVQVLEQSLQDSSGIMRSIAQITPRSSTKVLAECQTISISTHRDKSAVYACGSVYPKGYCRGPRAIAGSMIFTVFNEHVLFQFLEADTSDFDGNNNYTSAILDQIPPFDITIVFANEYGSLSRMALYGVEFVDEGQVMSIEDIITENTVSFVARDYDPMRSAGHRMTDHRNILTGEMSPGRASDLLLEEDFQSFKDAISPWGRFNTRRNPYR